MDNAVDMHELRDAIAAHGIPATLYMSGGNCATIGVGEERDDGDGGYFPYLVGVGDYADGIAYRDELSSGTYDGDCAEYDTRIGATETVPAYAARIVTAYRAYMRDTEADLRAAWHRAPAYGIVRVTAN